MTAFADSMRAHLADYKRRHYADLADGVHRGSKRAYAHILPEEAGRMNILPSLREGFWEYYEANRAELALHTDFHHLNSSQAFAFNTFYPWMLEREAQRSFLAALGARDDELSEWRFEKMPDEAERTTFDFAGQYQDGARLLVEVKLTEAHFGLVQNEEKYRLKRTQTYLPRLEGKVDPASLAEANFFLNYQLFRNVSHLNIAKGDQLVFLVPRANVFTWSQATAFTAILDPAARQCVRVVAVEDLIAGLATAASALGRQYREHVAELSEKYLCDVVA